MKKDEKFLVPHHLLKRILAKPEDKENAKLLERQQKQRRKFPAYIALVS